MNAVTEIIWKEIEPQLNLETIIETVIKKCFEVENIKPTSLYICVTLTNPQNIKEINNMYRNINKETDVLSFPMFEKDELDSIIQKNMIENNGFQDVMGDIIISIDRVKEQAVEYGHSFEREFAYMLVHGFYHLRGYDHMQENEKTEMRKKEENVLSKLNITR